MTNIGLWTVRFWEWKLCFLRSLLSVSLFAGSERTCVTFQRFPSSGLWVCASLQTGESFCSLLYSALYSPVLSLFAILCRPLFVRSLAARKSRPWSRRQILQSPREGYERCPTCLYLVLSGSGLHFNVCFLFQMLHQLMARAVIRDWTEGSLDFDRTEHEVISSLALCHFSVFIPVVQFIVRLQRETQSLSSSTPALSTPSSPSSPALLP